MIRSAKSAVDAGVFWIAICVATLFVAWGILFTDSLASIVTTIVDYTIATFGGVFILSINGFIVLLAFLCFSRYGRIKLGEDHDQPEFRTATWVAMMFGAGMAIGLVFYGVAEPMSHLSNPPFGLAQPGTEEAGQVAMQYSYFHRALHPWSTYAIVGLFLAYFTKRLRQ